jgi:peptide/nickel transport system substrate-binding protein
MVRTQRFVGLAAAAAVCLALITGCTAGGTQGGGTPSDGDAGTLALYSFTEPTSWDPAAFGESPYLPYALAVYDSLFVLDEKGQIAPKLATAYTYSDDNLQLTLTLKKGVTFSDGTPFDAAAVKANMEHFQKFATPAGPLLQNVGSVAVVDDSTVKLTLSRPDPGLLFSLSQAAGLMGNPKTLGTDEIAAKPDGTGPYTLDTSHSVAGSKYTFVRKDGYWDQKYPYSTVTYSVFPEETARLNAFKSGQIQYAHTTTASAALDAKNAVSGAGMEQGGVTWEGLFFFDRDGKMLPPLKDERVREALRISIDADAMIKTIRGGYGEATDQIFSPNMDAYDASLEGAYKYDPARAKQLLAEAGYPDGFTVPWPRTGSILPEIYTAISQYWSKIGVKTKDVQWAPGAAVKSIMAGDYGLVYFSNLELLDTWSVIQLSVAPDTQYNPFHSETPELNKLIATLQSATDANRAEAAKAVNKYLVEHYWYGPLYRPAMFYLTAPGIHLTVYPGYVQPPIWAFAPAK